MNLIKLFGYLNNIHEHLIQHSLKSGGFKDHLRWVKVPGTFSVNIKLICTCCDTDQKSLPNAAFLTVSKACTN